jgi:hypothetical protein
MGGFYEISADLQAWPEAATGVGLAMSTQNDAAAYGRESAPWTTLITDILGTAAKTGADVWRNKELAQAGIDPSTGKPFALGSVVDQTPLTQITQAIDTKTVLIGAVAIGLVIWALK